MSLAGLRQATRSTQLPRMTLPRLRTLKNTSLLHGLPPQSAGRQPTERPLRQANKRPLRGLPSQAAQIQYPQGWATQCSQRRRAPHRKTRQARPARAVCRMSSLTSATRWRPGTSCCCGDMRYSIDQRVKDQGTEAESDAAASVSLRSK